MPLRSKKTTNPEEEVQIILEGKTENNAEDIETKDNLSKVPIIQNSQTEIPIKVKYANRDSDNDLQTLATSIGQQFNAITQALNEMKRDIIILKENFIAHQKQVKDSVTVQMMSKGLNDSSSNLIAKLNEIQVIAQKQITASVSSRIDQDSRAVRDDFVTLSQTIAPRLNYLEKEISRLGKYY